MGLFGGKTIQYNPPPPPKLPTAEELFSAGSAQARNISPLAFGARESALADVARGPAFYDQFRMTAQPFGEISPSFYSQFGPTSLEEALGNQYFQNIMPNVEASILNQLSLAGVANSPIAARLIAQQRGQTGFDVGSYLANLAQTRATQALARQTDLANMGEQRALNSLNARNIDPYSMITPYVETGMKQGNAQAQLQYAYDQAKAQADLQNAIQKQQQKGAMGSTLGTLGGAALGALLAAPTGGMSLGMGALLGASLGGSAGNMFAGGGSQTPISFGDALSAYQAFQPTGGLTPTKVYSTPKLEPYQPLRGSLNNFQGFGSPFNPGY